MAQQRLSVHSLLCIESDTQKTWQVIKEVNEKKTLKLNGLPKKLNYHHQDITKESIIAKTFNEVFVNAGLNLASKLKHSEFNKEKYLTPSNSIMENAELTEKELLDAVSSLKLNKAQGFNNVSSNVVIKCIFYIKKVFLHIFNLSFKQGIFPKKLKIAKVIPVFKSGDDTNISNYRPISILPCSRKY
ncbi:uncharacterized protein LOC136085397 [Hydra vulgaris]|uniref:Uncharacterized protein LOC136085397 n=1 Tax=Hydra vulgaris TaxID=6087 RepID=A0ABM4CLV4_HYDVU